MDREQCLLLNHLDKPLRLMGVCKDEAISFIVPIFVGLSSGYTLSGFLSGMCFIATLKALKKQNEGAHLIQVLYWYLPTSKKHMKLYIPSHIREYVG